MLNHTNTISESTDIGYNTTQTLQQIQALSNRTFISKEAVYLSTISDLSFCYITLIIRLIKVLQR
jgi:hypothetical protein